MTERDSVEHRSTTPPLDSELDMKGILLSTVGVVVITVVAAASMWGFMVFFLDSFAAQDPPPPALEEAREPYLPPEPRLQTEPFGDLIELRAEEERLLTSYGWVNEPGGIAMVPIDRAIDLLIERGSAGPIKTLQPGTELDSSSSEDAEN